MHRVIVLIVAAMLPIAACDNKVGETEQDATSGNEADGTAPEAPGMLDRLFNRGEPMALDMVGQHESGMVVRLTGIQAKPTETIVNAEFVNGAESDKAMNQFGRGTYLQTVEGRKLALSAPPGNENLSIEAGARMDGELVFMGRIPEDDSILLMINEGEENSNRVDATPGFRFEIPLAAEAFSDDGSKKN